MPRPQTAAWYVVDDDVVQASTLASFKQRLARHDHFYLLLCYKLSLNVITVMCVFFNACKNLQKWSRQV